MRSPCRGHLCGRGGIPSLKGAAKVSHAYAEATTAKVTVIVGKAYGPVYIAAAGKSAGADVVLAWPEAVISPWHLQPPSMCSGRTGWRK